MDSISKRNPLFITVYLLSSVLFVFLALEGLVRLFGLAPPLVEQYGNYVSDPYLPYKPKPLSIRSGRSDEFNYEYRHNSFGIRDVEHSLQKPAEVFRILGLGDSFTYGVGAAFEETYLFRLEEMLNARTGNHPTVEIIKAGIPRYFPEPERLLLEHYGLQYEPDLILVGFLPNDVIDTTLGLEAVQLSGSGYLVRGGASTDTINWLYINSHLFRIILRYYLSSTQTEVQANFQPQEADWLLAEQKIASEFFGMIELAGQRGAEIVFVHIPQQGPWDVNAYGLALKLAQWSQSNNVTFIDVLPAMVEASPDQALYWEKDGHCTPDGYKVIAETIFWDLTRHELVP